MSVYFVQAGDTGYIKIGHARSVTKRLSTLQTGSANNLKVLYEMRGGHVEEQGLHAAFAKHRVRGEWFRPHQDILNWIARIKGEKPRQPIPRGSPLHGADGRFLDFIVTLTTEDSDDGKAANRLFIRFLSEDPQLKDIVAKAKVESGFDQ